MTDLKTDVAVEFNPKLNEIVSAVNETNLAVAAFISTTTKEIEQIKNSLVANAEYIQNLERSIRFDTQPATAYSSLLEPATIGALLIADQDMQQHIFSVDEQVTERLEEKTIASKRFKEVENEIKIVQSHEVMTPEFVMLKNAPQRDAAMRLASEAERTERAKLEGTIEECTNALYALRGIRESALAGLAGIRAKIDLTSSIFKYIGGK